MDNNEAKPTKITKTWFFERGDGKIFATGEEEAWGLLKNRSNWTRNDFKMIGVSSGMTYLKTIQSAEAEKKRVDEQVAEKTTELNRYVSTLDKFKFELLLDDADEKVVKVKGIIRGLQREINDLQAQFSKGYQDIVNKAFEAELAEARGHIEMPGNHDIKTPNKADRDVILRNISR